MLFSFLVSRFFKAVWALLYLLDRIASCNTCISFPICNIGFLFKERVTHANLAFPTAGSRLGEGREGGTTKIVDKNYTLWKKYIYFLVITKILKFIGKYRFIDLTVKFFLSFSLSIFSPFLSPFFLLLSFCFFLFSFCFLVFFFPFLNLFFLESSNLFCVGLSFALNFLCFYFFYFLFSFRSFPFLFFSTHDCSNIVL